MIHSAGAGRHEFGPLSPSTTVLVHNVGRFSSFAHVDTYPSAADLMVLNLVARYYTKQQPRKVSPKLSRYSADTSVRQNRAIEVK